MKQGRRRVARQHRPRRASPLQSAASTSFTRIDRALALGDRHGYTSSKALAWPGVAAGDGERALGDPHLRGARPGTPGARPRSKESGPRWTWVVTGLREFENSRNGRADTTPLELDRHPHGGGCAVGATDEVGCVSTFAAHGYAAPTAASPSTPSGTLARIPGRKRTHASATRAVPSTDSPASGPRTIGARAGC